MPYRHTEHRLISRVIGANRTPGKCVCSCGAEFAGLNRFKIHQADNRQDTLKANPQWKSARNEIRV